MNEYERANRDLIIVENISSQFMSTLEDKMGYKEEILLVDDDEIILKIVSDWITFRDFKVSTARDGTEAYDLFIKKKEQI